MGKSNKTIAIEAPFCSEAIDQHLDIILIASGSALRHYSMHQTINDMRTALKNAVVALSKVQTPQTFPPRIAALLIEVSENDFEDAEGLSLAEDAKAATAWLQAQADQSGTIKCLQHIAKRLRNAGADLPAPEIKGTIESSMKTGLSIALSIVEQEINANAPIHAGTNSDRSAA